MRRCGRIWRHGIVALVPPDRKTVASPESTNRPAVNATVTELGDSRVRLQVEVPAGEVVLEEAVRETLSSWYSDAIENAGIVPVGDPQLDLGELPAQGQALEFSVEIG